MARQHSIEKGAQDRALAVPRRTTSNSALWQEVLSQGGRHRARLLCGAMMPALHPSHPRQAMAGIHITDVESAINFWRARSPSRDGITLASQTRALAEVYALMVFHAEQEADEHSLPQAALQAWLEWYRTMPDTPCIAICSTSQGDETCKGCGRSFLEVQRWPEMSPAHKRQVWRRITMAGQAWRFNRYAERAVERASGAPAEALALAPRFNDSASL
jgi:predicted Fe-S protein YdhL (DUF1289 family)